jgi:flagellar L-ring protein precursor FlgH
MKTIFCLALIASTAFAARKPAAPALAASPLDRYVNESRARSAEAALPIPGAIWTAGSRMADSARDLRASQLDDMLTILVVESASAVSKGTTKTERTSGVDATVKAAAGITKLAGPLANLAGASGSRHLDAQGTTSRDVVISTTLTARVAAVMPNGVLIVDATKEVEVNSEKQIITVRGIVRPSDIGSDNTVRSDRLGQLEVRVNGKGVVGDAIKRPFILYRLIMGLLPF